MSPRFTKHLYLAPRSRRPKVPDLLVSLSTRPPKGRPTAWKPTNCASVLAPAFLLLRTRSRAQRQASYRGAGGHYGWQVPLPCVTEGEDQRVLGDDKGSKNSTLAAPLVSQVVACVVVWGVCNGGRAHLDRYNSFTPAPLYIDFSTSLKGPNLPRYSGWCPQKYPFPLDVTWANSSNNLKPWNREIYLTQTAAFVTRGCVVRGELRPLRLLFPPELVWV